MSTEFVDLKVFTHYPDGESGIGTTEHVLKGVHRDAVPSIVRGFYLGDGYTSVPEESLALLTRAQRYQLEERDD